MSAEPASKTRVGAFSRTGDYWTVGLGTSRFPIKDIKGLGYIHRLLQHPGQEFHALDLLSSAGAGTITADTVVGPEEALPVGLAIRRGLSGDAGEMLDAQAKREYQRRLHELNELLEDQRERGNHERADQIESEIEFLTRTIVRARGIGDASGAQGLTPNERVSASPARSRPRSRKFQTRTASWGPSLIVSFEPALSAGTFQPPRRP